VLGLPYKIPEGKEKNRSPVLRGMSSENKKMITQIAKQDYTPACRQAGISKESVSSA
jgi:hypothetical protein